MIFAWTYLIGSYLKAMVVIMTMFIIVVMCVAISSPKIMSRQESRTIEAFRKKWHQIGSEAVRMVSPFGMR